MSVGGAPQAKACGAFFGARRAKDRCSLACLEKELFDIFVAGQMDHGKCCQKVSEGIDKLLVPRVYKDYCRVYNQATD